MEKSKESVSRGAERIIIREHPRTYKRRHSQFCKLNEYIMPLASQKDYLHHAFHRF
ncbi:palindromic element RPE5 domain-containing protein [Rickettsia felis]|nr:palindromic element RPE5 domain-containing protein [Rickettsia felis]MDE8611193.1 palindromic element RPE5 domain-containing protein [Rickettsia felis]